jgi:hypothetical protein
MIPLKPPSKAQQEDKTLAILCKAPEWVAHHAVWQGAYETYRRNKGDPWKIAPAVFATDPAEVKTIAEAQQAFYKSRSGGGPIQRIRRTPGLLCCPMCGSQHPGTLDHYLPRESFPEFSILPCNLIPACPHCNSGVKKGRYRGTDSPERFIHPYFETLAKAPIWHVEVRPPFEAARFRPKVAGGIRASDRPMVQFHLDHILGEVFQDYVSTQWSQLPVLIYGWAVPNELITQQSVASQLANNLRDTAVTSGVNGWRTALLRGVTANQDAIAFLAGRATKVAALGCVT